MYDRLFTVEDPLAQAAAEGKDYHTFLNPDSLETITAQCEPALADAKQDGRFQFERIGYFVADPDSKPGAPAFNRTVTLKDAWAKEAKKS